eukprot:3948387-Pleurochrysis_carterae.AAC.1
MASGSPHQWGTTSIHASGGHSAVLATCLCSHGSTEVRHGTDVYQQRSNQHFAYTLLQNAGISTLTHNQILPTTILCNRQLHAFSYSSGSLFTFWLHKAGRRTGDLTGFRPLYPATTRHRMLRSELHQRLNPNRFAKQQSKHTQQQPQFSNTNCQHTLRWITPINHPLLMLCIPSLCSAPPLPYVDVFPTPPFYLPSSLQQSLTQEPLPVEPACFL